MKELSFKRPFIFSGLLHGLILVVLVAEFHHAKPVLVADTVNDPGIQQMAKVEPIKAVSVDSQEVMQAVEQLKAVQQQKIHAEQMHQQQLLQAAKAAQLAREREQAKLAQLKSEALRVEKEQKKKLEAEKQQIAELKKKQLELKKQQEEQARLAEKKLLEQKLAEKKLAEKKLAEKKLAEKKLAEQKSALAAKQKEALAQKQQALKAQQDAKLAAEEALRSARVAGEVDRYKAMIIGAIGRQWILPENVGPGLSSQFRIHLAPNGVVLDVSLIRSSGDPILDRSAQSAIYKASPLPVPSDPSTFNLFREISLTVRPENVRG